MTVLEKILAIAESKGIGQNELERLAHLPGNRISKYLAGQGDLSLEYAVRMAKALGVSIDTLALGVIAPPPGPPISEDEQFLLRFFRASGLTGDEAVAILSGRKPPRRKSRQPAREIRRAYLFFDPPRQQKRADRKAGPTILAGEPTPLPSPSSDPNEIEINQGPRPEPERRSTPKRKR
jgi:transcriptional regulator with XRE-family HTH domain